MGVGFLSKGSCCTSARQCDAVPAVGVAGCFPTVVWPQRVAHRNHDFTMQFEEHFASDV